MRRLASIAFFASIPMLGCGTATEGSSCNTAGFLCADATAALECKANLWVSLPCKGPNGCKVERQMASAGRSADSGFDSRLIDVVKCDISANDEGDRCPSSAAGRGLCTKDMKGTLECREGRLVKTNNCRTCTVTDVVNCLQ